jgi:hypothetical protein
MARHRNIRRLNFEDEYEEEDSYGRSVEDDPEMSPTMAQFMYRRGDDDRSRSLSSFMRPECKPEANKFPVAAATEATPLEDGRLAEAVKQVQDVLGDTINLATVKQALLQYDYDVARATDRILSDQDFEKQKPALVAAIQATTDFSPAVTVATSVSNGAAAAKFVSQQPASVPSSRGRRLINFDLLLSVYLSAIPTSI